MGLRWRGGAGGYAPAVAAEGDEGADIEVGTKRLYASGAGAATAAASGTSKKGAAKCCKGCGCHMRGCNCGPRCQGCVCGTAVVTGTTSAAAPASLGLP